MSWFGSLLARRSSLATPEKWLVNWFAGGPAVASGVMVTHDTALRLTAVLACVRIIAETVGSLPCLVYRRLSSGGKERDPHHPLYSLLHDQPNAWQTAMEFFEMMTGHAALRGNGYALIVGGGGTAIEALIPLHPDRVRVKVYQPGKLAYEYTPPTGPVETYLQGEILHLRGFGSDGYVGYSPIDLAREAVGLGLAAEEFGARFFGNAAVPAGVIETTKVLSDSAKKRFAESFSESYRRTGRFGTPVLEDGMSYKAIGIPLDHAQFLETRRYQVEEIARIFRVPPHLLQNLERATNNNIEQQSLDFLIHTLRPWLVRWEQAIRRDLFLDRWRQTHTVEWLVDALLRGDAKSRAEALQIQRQNGIINADEWREIENRNPIEDGGGKVYLVNSAMVSPTEAAEGAPPGDATPASDEDPGTRSLAPIIRRSHEALVDDVMGRMRRREAQLLERRGKKSLPVLFEGHAEYAARAMEPVLRSHGLILRSDIPGLATVDEARITAWTHNYVASWATRHVDALVAGDAAPTPAQVLEAYETALMGTLAAIAA